MIAFGVIVILIAALLALGGFWVATGQNTSLRIESGWLNFEVSPLLLFLAGAAAVGLLWLGLWMITSGTRSAIRRRGERKQLQRDARDQEAKLAATRARLNSERTSERETPTTYGQATSTTYGQGTPTQPGSTAVDPPSEQRY